MSKYILVAVALVVVLGSVAAVTDEFTSFARKHGGLTAPEQRLPVEGGHCPDVLGNWQCPVYHFFRDRFGFEFRLYNPTNAVVCSTGGTPGRIYENLFPCYRQLDDYFLGQNSAGIRINRTAPVGVEVVAVSAGREEYGVIFFLPEALTKPPEPRAGSPIRVVEVPPIVLVSMTFGPTDLWGPFGPNEGDYQVYDAAATLIFRLQRRGYPIYQNIFLFGTYSAPPAAERRANLRHEVWVPLNINSSASSFSFTGITPKVTAL